MIYDNFIKLNGEEREDWFINAYENNMLEDDPFWIENFSDIVDGDWFLQADRIRQEDRRWYAWVDVILRVKDRYFRIGYDMGLTECQENDYEDKSIVEVYPVKRQITTTVTDWIEK